MSKIVLVDLPVVLEYEEIYAEVPRLPSVVEVEFGIDLLPGSTPIHRSPSYMPLQLLAH